MPNSPTLLQAKIIAVVTIKNVKNAAIIAESLLNGGVNHIEVTLRSDQAIASIAEIAKQVPEMNVGAGTILNTDQLLAARDSGAKFSFSPGFDPKLAEKAITEGISYVPGTASASEVQQALSMGLTTLKLFPAAHCGGEKLLNALYAPFPQAIFCPTGGINKDNMQSYLKLPNVFAVGGSWLATKDIIESQQWQQITERSQEALKSSLP